jgi:hypothetical protein
MIFRALDLAATVIDQRVLLKVKFPKRGNVDISAASVLKIRAEDARGPFIFPKMKREIKSTIVNRREV